VRVRADVAVSCEAGFAPQVGLTANFAEASGAIWVCPPRFWKRGLDERNSVRAVLVAGGALYVEFASEGINLQTLKLVLIRSSNVWRRYEH